MKFDINKLLYFTRKPLIDLLKLNLKIFFLFFIAFSCKTNKNEEKETIADLYDTAITEIAEVKKLQNKKLPDKFSDKKKLTSDVIVNKIQELTDFINKNKNLFDDEHEQSQFFSFNIMKSLYNKMTDKNIDPKIQKEAIVFNEALNNSSKPMLKQLSLRKKFKDLIKMIINKKLDIKNIIEKTYTTYPEIPLLSTRERKNKHCCILP